MLPFTIKRRNYTNQGCPSQESTRCHQKHLATSFRACQQHSRQHLLLISRYLRALCAPCTSLSCSDICRSLSTHRTAAPNICILKKKNKTRCSFSPRVGPAVPPAPPVQTRLLSAAPASCAEQTCLPACPAALVQLITTWAAPLRTCAYPPAIVTCSPLSQSDCPCACTTFPACLRAGTHKSWAHCATHKPGTCTLADAHTNQTCGSPTPSFPIATALWLFFLPSDFLLGNPPTLFLLSK
jgi:hypothetical protein